MSELIVSKPDPADYDWEIPDDLKAYWEAYGRWLEWRHRYRRDWLRACKPWYWQKEKRYRWYDTYTYYIRGYVSPGKNWPVIVFFEWWVM